MDETYRKRLERHYDELKWLYMELYDDEESFEGLCAGMLDAWQNRMEELRVLDTAREENPDWFKGNALLGMTMYAGQFAGNLKGVAEHLDYVRACGVNCLHLMPLMKTPAGRSDGGYSVADFRRVQKELGTVEDLKELASRCRAQGISLCLDLVMNHTSEEHEWAIRARNGEEEYQKRYFFYEGWEVPMQFERTLPQVFPTTAPGNFTWIPQAGKHVMTTFYPYQWDLNYANPAVFNEMAGNLLYLADLGVDVILLDAVVFIWKQLGTDCRSLPQVHTLLRMLRIICEVVCPGVLLLGEADLELREAAAYFGTPEKPECHMLYNEASMAVIWHTVAVQNVRLLKRQMEIAYGIPGKHTFVNYLRSHDDIRWKLDYGDLEEQGMRELSHRQFLNDFFTGNNEYSFSRGELYNNDPITRDARFCGTTASMCGVERASLCGDQAGMDQALRLDIMLHALLLFQPGIPMLYSGDEIACVNDYSYKDDWEKILDARFIHRGVFPWGQAEERNREGTPQNYIFNRLRALEELRSAQPAFREGAFITTIDTQDDAVLQLERTAGGERITGIFNFSRNRKELPWEMGGEALVNPRSMTGDGRIVLLPYDFVWVKTACF